MKIIPARKIEARVRRVLKAQGNDFVSREVDTLELTYGGIKGDYHEGVLRKSGGREPWYPRRTEMRNERQLSILSEEELEEIAKGMGLDVVEPGWIGANLVLEGIPSMSYLPSRTILMFEGGVSLRIDGYNAPCRFAGGEIARAIGAKAEDLTRSETALDFVKQAHMKRGLVAWVERQGEIHAGEKVTARIWDQWIYED